MGEPVPPDDGIEPHVRALIALHALSPDYRVEREKLPEHYRGRDIGADLRQVAEADPEQIPPSARLAVLYDLAKAGYPGRADDPDGYRELADSAVRFRALREEDAEVAGDDLLEEIKAAADAGAPLSSRPRVAERTFRHHEVAFIGKRVCTIERVQVDGIEANWIYSEFETDAPFQGIADGFDPHHWPNLGPMFFKRMELVGSAAPLPLQPPPEGDPHWHGVFLEEVQLVRRLRTTLSCSHWRDAQTAATTYDLKDSLDGEIDVDRGYLLVTTDGQKCRVQVLKIVSFTDDFWDAVALFVCPFWTDWIRGAVEGGQTTDVLPPSQRPDSDSSPLGRSIEAWVEFFGDAVKPYLEVCGRAESRISSGSYSSAQLVADGAQWWSRFARDWARAWTNVSETVEDVAREGLDAGVTPPGTPRERGRGAVRVLTETVTAAPSDAGRRVPVAGLAADDRPACSKLVSIGRGAATIPPDEISVTVEEDGRVRVRTTNPSAEHGLYVGQLQNAAKQVLAPVQVYVSRATRA